jgi:hypothetical protein
LTLIYLYLIVIHMVDKKEPEEPKPQALVDDKAIFALAYVAALKQLEELTEEEKRIAVQKARLRDTMKALGPLFNPKHADIKGLTLSNAIRLVISSTGRPISALEIRGKLKDWGYDLDKFENPMASIHTALSRMEEADELSRKPSEDGKKKFEPGPELKSVPDGLFPQTMKALELEPTLDELREVMGAEGKE